MVDTRAMRAELRFLEGGGRGRGENLCSACLRDCFPQEDRSLCPDCVERAVILSELIGVSDEFAREVLPSYMREVARRRVETDLDPEEETGLTRIDASADSVYGGNRLRVVRERQLPGA